MRWLAPNPRRPRRRFLPLLIPNVSFVLRILCSVVSFCSHSLELFQNVRLQQVPVDVDNGFIQLFFLCRSRRVPSRAQLFHFLRRVVFFSLSRSSGVSWRYPCCNFITSAKMFRSSIMLLRSPSMLTAASASCIVFGFVTFFFLRFSPSSWFLLLRRRFILLFFLLSLLLLLFFFLPACFFKWALSPSPAEFRKRAKRGGSSRSGLLLSG